MRDQTVIARMKSYNIRGRKKARVEAGTPTRGQKSEARKMPTEKEDTGDEVEVEVDEEEKQRR